MLYSNSQTSAPSPASTERLTSLCQQWYASLISFITHHWLSIGSLFWRVQRKYKQKKISMHHYGSGKQAYSLYCQVGRNTDWFHIYNLFYQWYVEYICGYIRYVLQKGNLCCGQIPMASQRAVTTKSRCWKEMHAATETLADLEQNSSCFLITKWSGVRCVYPNYWHRA